MTLELCMKWQQDFNPKKDFFFVKVKSKFTRISPVNQKINKPEPSVYDLTVCL